MELYILCPTLAVGILFSLTVLLYSLSKVAGNPFKRAATQPVKSDDTVSVAASTSGNALILASMWAKGCRRGA